MEDYTPMSFPALAIEFGDKRMLGFQISNLYPFSWHESLLPLPELKFSKSPKKYIPQGLLKKSEPHQVSSQLIISATLYKFFQFFK